MADMTNQELEGRLHGHRYALMTLIIALDRKNVLSTQEFGAALDRAASIYRDRLDRRGIGTEVSALALEELQWLSEALKDDDDPQRPQFTVVDGGQP